MKKGKILAYALLFSGFIIVQKSLIPILFYGLHVPDVVLMLILALAVIDGFDEFLPWAVFAGILYDFTSHSIVGLHVLIFVCIVYFVSFFSRRFLVDMRSMGVALLSFFVIFATLVSHFFIAAWIGWSNYSMRDFVGALGNGYDIFVLVVYNALTFVFLFVIVRKVKKKNIALIRKN